MPSLERALDRGLELTPAGGELTVLPTYTAMLALRRIVAGRGHVANYWEPARVKIRVGHLYPDYLNIYADRGNIAVLAARARARGHELEVEAIGMGDPVPAGGIDLFYVGGGQDREQELVAPRSRREEPSALARGGRGRRRVPRGLRRLPAARPLLPRRRRHRAARASGCCRCTPWPASGG